MQATVGVEYAGRRAWNTERGKLSPSGWTGWCVLRYVGTGGVHFWVDTRQVDGSSGIRDSELPCMAAPDVW